MATNDQSVTIEGFVTDTAFEDMTKSINGIFTNAGGKIASLTPQALSYFTTPSVFADHRSPADRHVNWVTQSVPKVVVDSTAFSTFVNTINTLAGADSVGFFKLIDALLFNYDPSVTHSTLETFLTTDSDIKQLYVAGSFSVSSVLITDPVYLAGNSTHPVTVPSYINFEMILPTGSTTTTFVMKLYASVDAWIAGYNVSSIIKIIPPLPYDKLFEASLTTTTDNIFSTASLTTTLNYDATLPVFGSISLSGTSEYKAVVTDGNVSVIVPINILYKGRAPTLFEIRNAIKAALLSSGVSDAAGWKARIPGVFVDGRFYIVPLWDILYTKPDQTIFPNIAPYKLYNDKTNQILSSLGYGDISDQLNVFSVYYNKMTATAIPDLSGTVDVSQLITLIPDYQDYSPSDEGFSYMLPLSQLFARDLNTILAVDSGAQTSSVYTPMTEGLLSFYSYTVSNFEICVITKICYTTIVGSTQ